MIKINYTMRKEIPDLPDNPIHPPKEPNEIPPVNDPKPTDGDQPKKYRVE